MQIRPCKTEDVAQICAIYNHYIEHTVITFEEQLLRPQELQQRIEHYTRSYPWLVCEVAGQVVGYAYAAPWRERSAYRHSVEVSVYLHQDATGRGYGKALYAELLEALAKLNCHAILSGIALPNDASVALHESFGFEKVAHLREVGLKFGRWVDVGYWQKVMPGSDK